MSAWLAARAAAHADGMVYSISKSWAAFPCSKSHIKGAVLRKEMAEMRRPGMKHRV